MYWKNKSYNNQKIPKIKTGSLFSLRGFNFNLRTDNFEKQKINKKIQHRQADKMQVETGPPTKANYLM